MTSYLILLILNDIIHWVSINSFVWVHGVWRYRSLQKKIVCNLLTRINDVKNRNLYTQWTPGALWVSVGFWVRIVLSTPLACLTRQLMGPVLQLRPQKLRLRIAYNCCRTIKITPGPKATRADTAYSNIYEMDVKATYNYNQICCSNECLGTIRI